MLREHVTPIAAAPADQTDVDQALIVAGDTGADLGLKPTRQQRAVAVDQPVVADVLPAVALGRGIGVLAPDLLARFACAERS